MAFGDTRGVNNQPVALSDTDGVNNQLVALSDTDGVNNQLVALSDTGGVNNKNWWQYPRPYQNDIDSKMENYPSKLHNTLI